MKSIWKLVLATCLSLIGQFSYGQDLVVGMVNQLKDPTSIGSQTRAGVQLYFDAVNERGGVNGAKLKLVTRDRGPDGPDTVEKTRLLLQEEKPLALIGMTGTAPMEALLKDRVLETAGVPMIGPRSGAQTLHEPVNKWVFHTRASYAQEIDKIAGHMATIGRRKIAVFYEKTVFGLEGYGQAQRAIKARSLQLVGTATYDYGSTEVKAAVDGITKAKPDGVIVIAASPAVAEFYKQLRASGSSAFVVAISAAEGPVVAKRIGAAAAHGLGIAEVGPDPTSKTSLLIRELHEDHKKHGTVEPSVAVVQGYIAARVLVEGLRRAGPKPTSAKLRTALEGIKDLNVGGFGVKYSPTNHSGSSYANIAVVAPDGRMLR